MYPNPRPLERLRRLQYSDVQACLSTEIIDGFAFSEVDSLEVPTTGRGVDISPPHLSLRLNYYARDEAFLLLVRYADL